jgi:glucokinase
MRSLVMLTLGTGIGGGLINEGKIVEGSHSHAAECGHIVIQMDGGRPCTCGRSGHLEAYASATSLVKRAEEALGRETGSLLYNELERGQLTSQAIHHAAEAGDALAQRLMAETARYLAIGATTMMLAINPDMIVFGGGMIAAGSKFLEAIQAHVHGLTFPIPAQKTRIAFAELGGDAGFIGAAGCARMAHQAGTTAPTPSR